MELYSEIIVKTANGGELYHIGMVILGDILCQHLAHSDLY